jgi:hypothetical protein
MGNSPTSESQLSKSVVYLSYVLGKLKIAVLRVDISYLPNFHRRQGFKTFVSLDKVNYLKR